MGDEEEAEFDPEYEAELELDANALFGEFDESGTCTW